MRLRLSKLLILGVLASALLATAGSAATTQFATGLVTPETISQTASGGFLVTDAGPSSNTTGLPSPEQPSPRSGRARCHD
jgi:hypothetical protein